VPQYRALVVVLYDDYLKALRHVAELCESNPAAIEILDDKLISQAQQDPVWHDLQAVFRDQSLDRSLRAINFIEVVGDDKTSIRRQCEKFDAHIKRTSSAYAVVSSLVETDARAIASLWNLRNRSVGLLAAMKDKPQGLAFVEDSAVPPERLADYVEEFRALLDNHAIDYAMYGHADVGCLHVRPMLDMTQQSNRKMIRSISDGVAALAKQYGGLLWGEHGRGYRGEYSPLFFGEHLMPVLHQIKTAFDPGNLFNPGKLAVPAGNSIVVEKIDEVPFRGAFDEQIEPDWASRYNSAINCNGNAVCFSWQVDDAMCPSYKATKDKTLSPKGRAAMLREWARLQSIDPDSYQLGALESEIQRSLNACLSCKSCSYSCPLKVDIPELKSSFLEYYHRSHGRPLRDRLFANLESLLDIGRSLPGLANLLTNNPLSRLVLRQVFGVVALPVFSASLEKGLAVRQVRCLELDKLPQRESCGENQVILLADSFNASFDSGVLLAACDLLHVLGYQVLLAPLSHNGKALHVRGFRDRFQRLAVEQVEKVSRLAVTGLPLISLEVVTRLMHEKEYADVSGRDADYRIWSIESWLAAQFATGRLKHKLNQLAADVKNSTEILLLPHCMEQTADRQSSRDWQTVFEYLGLSLTVKAAGCCGMAGLFGHERENRQLSEEIFALNWQGLTDSHAGPIVASGFSCRCQLKNGGKTVQHPLVLLSNII
jgi:Fe-S oxidoreductase